MRMMAEREKEIRNKWAECNGPNGGTVMGHEFAVDHFDELLIEIDSLRAQYKLLCESNEGFLDNHIRLREDNERLRKLVKITFEEYESVMKGIKK